MQKKILSYFSFYLVPQRIVCVVIDGGGQFAGRLRPGFGLKVKVEAFLPACGENNGVVEII